MLQRAVQLSVGLINRFQNTAIWQALMLAGTRLNQLYTILGQWRRIPTRRIRRWASATRARGSGGPCL